MKPIEALKQLFNAEERDNKRAEYQSEPIKIDGSLEIVNAVTDVVE